MLFSKNHTKKTPFGGVFYHFSQ